MKIFHEQTVLLPFDFSDPARRTMDQVRGWSDPSTEIHVVSVVEPTLSLVALDQAIPVPPSSDTEAREEALQQLHELFGEAENPKIHLHCRIGDPGQEIVSLAESLSADMIIMSSHGRTGISRLLLGSVAERVLRLSSCPVLIVRGKPVETASDESGVPAADNE